MPWEAETRAMKTILSIIDCCANTHPVDNTRDPVLDAKERNGSFFSLTSYFFVGAGPGTGHCAEESTGNVGRNNTKGNQSPWTNVYRK